MRTIVFAVVGGHRHGDFLAPVKEDRAVQAGGGGGHGGAIDLPFVAQGHRIAVVVAGAHECGDGVG